MIPRIILTLLPLILPLYTVRFHIGPLPTTLLEIFVIVFFIIWLSSLLFPSSLRRQGSSLDRLGWIPAFAGMTIWAGMTKSKWFWPALLWLLAGLVGVFVAQDKIGALGLWRAYFLEPVVIFAMLLDLVRTEDDRRILLRSVCASVIVVAIWAIFQYLTGIGIPKPWNAPPAGIRATGPFPYPNALALFVVPVAALCFHFLIRKSRLLHRGWLISGFIGGLIATILAKSDGGLIALGAAIFVSLVLDKKLRRFAIAATLIGGMIIAFVPTLRRTAENQLLFKEWSGKVRLVMWDETRNMLRDHPLFGVGLGGYPDGIKPYHKATWMEIFQYPHNILLNLWSETGLLGVVAFGWILVTWIRMSQANTSVRPYSALVILTAILVHGLVDVPYFKNDLAIAFWVLVILTTRVEKTSTYAQ